MADKLQAIRGMHDLLPDATDRWQVVEEQLRSVLQSYGYREIRTPLLEKTELFCRSIGEATDIVEKEMYAFRDRNEDALALRPEGTASCVRACIEHSLLRTRGHRLWYMGPMFRRERPQKGRYRQFYQVGVETFGMEGPDIDAELMIMTARIWQALGVEDLQLQINSLGTPHSRAQYREALVAYLQGHFEQLDSDSQRRLSTNPLRVLDSKDERTKQIVAQAPVLMDYLDDGSKKHFDQLQQILQSAGVAYVHNTCLVRGLDYYTKTVFEWVSQKLGAQGTVCAGGRFDGLVEQLGGSDTPAAGFAMGLERLMSLVPDDKIQVGLRPPHAYLIMVGERAILEGLAIAEQLRDQMPNLRLQTHCGGGSFKSQFKQADRSGARWALILGEEELQNQTIGLKFLRDDKSQQTLTRQALPETLQNFLTN